jgi:YadA-like membrane anchor domain
MKNFKRIRLSAVAIATLTLSSMAAATPGNYLVAADEDNTGNEWLILKSGNDTFIEVNSNDNIAMYANGNISLNAGSTNINSPTSINSGNGSSELSVGTGTVTTIGTLTQTGMTSLSGTTSITGATSINASGTAVTNIGTAGGYTNIGSASSVNTIVGTTTSTGAFTQTGVTSINTTGASNTTIGNAGNTTTIQSGTNIITGAANSMLSTGANTITAATSNNISAATNNMTATTANNIQGPLNNMGTSSVSANNIGNTSGDTTVTATAGNARQALANGSANTTVTAGTSGLAARVDTPNVTTTGQVLLSNTGGTTVDANGKILTSTAIDYVNPAAPTAAVTLTNGYGNTHGLVVTESQTTISGGTESSSMTLTDRAATFSNAQTGAPITVTGVADGRADFDAVNVRQFAGAIASVAAQANIPALAAGQDRTFGMGVGHFMGKSALAMGMNIRGDGNAVYKVTLSSGLNDGAKKAVFAAGAAWGF